MSTKARRRSVKCLLLGCCVLAASLSAAEARQPKGIPAPIDFDLADAIGTGSPARVRFLLAAGADPNAVDSAGFPMLYLAVLANDAAVLEVLLAAGADVEAEGPTGDRPLLAAIHSGSTQIARLLLSSGAEVDAVNVGGAALRYAVTADDVEMVRLLVDAGASPHALNNLGSTVLDYARNTGNTAIQTILGGEQETWMPCLRFEEPLALSLPSAAPRLAIQVGHGGENIQAAAVSANGQVALTGGWDNLARLWHSPTGRELRALHGHSEWVEAVSLSADGVLALTGSRDGTAFLWDSRTGRRLLRLGHRGGESPPPILAVALSSDGSLALTATAEHGVALWDTTSCTRLELLELPGILSAASLSPDSRLVVAGTEEGTIAIWERATGNLLRRFAAHEGAISSLTVSRDGTRLLSTSGSLGYGRMGDEMAVLWDLASGAVVQRFGPQAEPVVNGLHSAAFVGKRTVLTSDGEGLYLWDTVTGEKTAEVVDVFIGFAAVAIAPGARCALAAGREIALFVDIEKRELCVPPLVGATFGVTSLRPSADDSALLAAAGFAVAWDLEASQESRRFEVEDETITSADWFGDLVATGGSLGPARIWNLTTGAELRQIRRPRSVFSRVAFTADGNALLTAGGERFAFTDDLVPIEQDYSLFLWDLQGRSVARLAGDDYPVASVGLSQDGARLFSTGFMTIREWELPSGSLLGEVDFGPPAQPLALAVEPGDGGRLAVGTDALFRLGQPLRIVDVTDGGGSLALLGAASSVRSVTFSRDGRRVYAGSDDGIIRSYDVGTGQHLSEWVHGTPVTALTTLGREWLASGAVDGSTVLWDAVRGSELVRLFSFRDGAWLVVDSEGRFDTNDFDGLGSAHWLLSEDPLRPLPLEIFTRDYFVPRLLARSLGGEKLGETAPIRDLSDLNLAQPKVEILGVDMSEDDPSFATVTVAVEAGRRPRNHGQSGAEDRTDVYDLRLFREGQLVAVAPPEEFGLAPSPGADLPAWRSSRKVSLVDGRSTVALSVRLPARRRGQEIEFSAYAFNEDRIKSETARISAELPGTPRPRSGRAYVIVIGVGDNSSFAWKLYTPGNDARLAARQLPRLLERSGRYERVVTVPLISHLEGSFNDGTPCSEMPPTKERVRAVFALLSGTAVAETSGVDVPCAAELEVAGPDDAVWIVYSGHGYAEHDGSFYLLPYDMDGIHRGNLMKEGLARAVSSDELAGWLRGVDAGEFFLAIDACQAAAIVETGGFRPGPLGDSGFGQLAYDKRMTVISATQSDAIAVGAGAAAGGHGLLFYSLLEEGLARGLADRRPHDGRLTLNEWLDYSMARVPELFLETSGADSEPQQPSIYDFTRSFDWSWEVPQ